MGPSIVIIFYYINPNKMHMLQSVFFLTTALHVSGVTITHLQETCRAVVRKNKLCNMSILLGFI
jgi:hypothetical protein